jgi:hypothetical protein
VLLGLASPYEALCLDNAVAEFGRALEAELSKVEGKTAKEIEVKSERVIRNWLDMPQRYRDPVRAGVVAPPAPKPEVTEG